MPVVIRGLWSRPRTGKDTSAMWLGGKPYVPAKPRLTACRRQSQRGQHMDRMFTERQKRS